MKYYPLQLHKQLSFKNDEEVQCVNKFFNTDKIENKNYNVFVWVKGYEEKQKGIIPIGEICEIALQFGNRTKYGKNIEGVFNFEINENNLYVKELTIFEWLEKYKKQINA